MKENSFHGILHNTTTQYPYSPICISIQHPHRQLCLDPLLYCIVLFCLFVCLFVLCVSVCVFFFFFRFVVEKWIEFVQSSVAVLNFTVPISYGQQYAVSLLDDFLVVPPSLCTGFPWPGFLSARTTTSGRPLQEWQIHLPKYRRELHYNQTLFQFPK